MDENHSTNMPPLGSSGRDTAVALARGAVGAMPFAGAILGEVISIIIPEQRKERLEDYVRRLNERLSDLEESELQSRFRDAETVDLFEEGAWQSARALSDERRQYIASIVANGISGDQEKRIESRRILALMREIDDMQMILLASHLQKYERDEGFRERHAAVLRPIMTHLQSEPAAFDAEALQNAATAKLIRLDLLAPHFVLPRGSEAPRFDEHSGTLKAQRVELTTLGRLLLRNIGVAGPEDL